MIAVLYALLTTATYYLGAHAQVTSWLWSRYPPGVDRFMYCAACAGTWYGAGWGAVGAWREWPFLGLPGRDALTVICVAAASMVWTPVLAYAHLHVLRALGEEMVTAAELRDVDERDA